ncbi:nuclear transport factor 2 family protein [Limnobacter parvus]|uniref:Nuclear transport factor 2 family protein n=1 Tax=Limnobacter parvus TaxID=2939690 RepID=A0ABT1XED5_9BURK|nr:nuclear transport factor 2 family protein [Limnobacter parvus]MCR2745628.1 nuclear transport factor 2 family protein [Limnobacter parvus]
MSKSNNANGLAPLNRQELSEPLRRLIDFFEHITEQSVAEMPKFYAANAYFKDPFNEVNRVEDIARIFGEMFHQVNNPRFVVHTAFESGQQVFMAWDFLFEMKRFKVGKVQRIKGSSHLILNQTGLVQSHRDYWDTAEELYEKIPVLGALMRWLKKQAG